MRRLLAVLLALLLPSSAFAAGTIVYQGGAGSVQEQVNRSIANTAPSFSLTDTTASAKSLTIAVDANLAQLRESAGAAGSLLVLDLANNRVGIGATPSQILHLYNSGDLTFIQFSGSSGLAGYIGGINSAGSGFLTSSALDMVYRAEGSNILFGFSNVEKVRITSGGNVGIGASPASLLDLRAGDLTQSGANGQKYVQGRATELITVASGVLTQASTITIPANAILKAAEMRVTIQPGGTATVVATATTSATILQQGASMSTAAGTTDVGTRAWGTNYVGVAAQTVTFTFNGVTSDALGRIRLDLYYEVPTAATS